MDDGPVIAVLSAPSNLGLRPPEPGSVPGTAKAPEALRATALLPRLRARDAGVVLPGRYVDDDGRRPAGRVRNQDALVDHSRRLGAAVREVLESGDLPLVLGGDCSILLGAGLALRGSGDVGLIHVDGHTDFRHPGNTEPCASVAGEDLAAAVGSHWPAIADIDGRGPYFAPHRVAHVGCRDDDEHRAEVAGVLAAVVPASEVLEAGGAAVARRLRSALDGRPFWLQVDVDVLDPSVMPAVDSPDDGGIEARDLVDLIRGLAPGAVGVSVTVFDPDLDPDGSRAALLGDILVEGLAGRSR